MTRGEARALLHCSILIVLAAIGRCALTRPAGPAFLATGLGPAGDVDSALAAAESIRMERERRSRPLSAGETIDLNSASVGELERLPGVGPALAAEIVRHRERGGPFHSLEDVEQVPGLGSKKVRRMAPSLAPFPMERAPWGAGPVRAAETRLDLNRASAQELTALPGIGPVKAAAIVRWREEHGRFRAVEQLTEVPGIGPATVSKLQALVRAGP